MSGITKAQTLLEQIERSVEAGDLVAATELISGLRPLLNSAHIDELAALKKRVDALNVTVHHHRGRQKAELMQLTENNTAIAQYRQIAGG